MGAKPARVLGVVLQFLNLGLLLKRRQRLHQTFERKVVEFVAGDLRHLGLCHAGDRGGLSLTAPPASVGPARAAR